MGDVSSGMASTVIQLYLKGILNSFLHTSVQVRQAVLKVIQLILAQGLVHPVQVFINYNLVFNCKLYILFDFLLLDCAVSYMYEH